MNTKITDTFIQIKLARMLIYQNLYLNYYLPKEISLFWIWVCGNGWLASLLISKGFNVYGTDASTSGIDIARKKFS